MFVIFVTFDVSKELGRDSEARADVSQNIKLISSTFEVSKYSGRVSEVRA